MARWNAHPLMPHFRSIILASLLLALSLAMAPAQTPPAPTPAPVDQDLTDGQLPPLETLELRLREYESGTGVEEAYRQTLIDQTRQAIDTLKAIAALSAQTAALGAIIQNAPATMETIRAEMAAPINEAQIEADIEEIETVTQVEQRSSQRNLELSQARSRLADVERSLTELRNRPAILRQLITDTRARIATLTAEIAALASSDATPSVVTQAQRISLSARRRLAQEELKAYEQEQTGFDMRLALLSAQRDQITREINVLDVRLRALQERSFELRSQEAEQALTQAQLTEQQIAQLPELLANEARRNIALNRQIQDLILKEKVLADQLEQTRSQEQDINVRLTQAQTRVDLVGLNQAIGEWMRKQKRDIPDSKDFLRESQATQDLITSLTLRTLEVDEERRGLPLLETDLFRIPADLRAMGENAEAQRIQSDTERILQERRVLLGRIQALLERMIRDNGDRMEAKKNLERTVREFTEFIDQKLIWIRGMPITNLHSLRAASRAIFYIEAPRVRRQLWPELFGPPLPTPLHDGDGATTDALSVQRRQVGDLLMDRFARARGLASPRQLVGALRDVGAALSVRPVVLLLGTLLFALAYLLARLDRERSGRFTEKGYVRRNLSFLATLEALVIVMVQATIAPLFLAFLGWRLAVLPSAADLTVILSQGLIKASMVYATIALIRALCADGGIGQAIFGWAKMARHHVRRMLAFLKYGLIPTSFLYAGIDLLEVEDYLELGRLAFLIAMAWTTLFAWRLLRFGNGFVTSAMLNNPDGMFYRYRLLWFPAAISIPALLFLFAFSGYYYAALRFSWHVWQSVLLLLAINLTKNLLLYGIRITHRNMVIGQTSPPGASAGAGSAAEGTSDDRESRGASLLDEKVTQEVKQHLARLSEQTRSLLDAAVILTVLFGLWWVWQSVFPALQFLEDIPVYAYKAVVDGQEQRVTISLARALLALLVGTIIFGAAHHVPYVLELTVLSRLRIDQGGRFAVATLSRYAISVAGVIFVLNVIGVRWAHIQWLVAALGIGLGLGLQDFVMNFISGIVMLFERPVRVGDTVTVGDLHGTVSKIHIRSTTITDWDMKELIVPNKEFIASRLVNWSLSTPILRVRITVGIAHGSDTALAEKILLQVAEDNALVLENPDPSVTFASFGASSLEFRLHIYVASIDVYMRAVHQLNMAIAEAFHEAGIVIAFPQQDSHLTTKTPLDIRLVREPRKLSPLVQAPSQMTIVDPPSDTSDRPDAGPRGGLKKTP